MTRETKIGLVVAGSFLCLVCVVVASKLHRGDDAVNGATEEQTAPQVAAVKSPSPSPAAPDAKRKTESTKPGTLPAQPGSQGPPLAPPPLTPAGGASPPLDAGLPPLPAPAAFPTNVTAPSLPPPAEVGKAELDKQKEPTIPQPTITFPPVGTPPIEEKKVEVAQPAVPMVPPIEATPIVVDPVAGLKTTDKPSAGFWSSVPQETTAKNHPAKTNPTEPGPAVPPIPLETAAPTFPGTFAPLPEEGKVPSFPSLNPPTPLTKENPPAPSIKPDVKVVAVPTDSVTPGIIPRIPGIDTPKDKSGKPVPTIRDTALHVCQPGETNLAIVSTKVYGSDKYADALLKYNRDLHKVTADGAVFLTDNPTLLPGQHVQVAPVSILERDPYRNLIRGASAAVVPDSPKSMPTIPSITPPVLSKPSPLGSGVSTVSNPPGPGQARTYVVQNPAGESILDIAERVMGDRAHWHKIWRVNSQYEPQYRIPAGAKLEIPAN